ncbi:ABC transporter permease [Gemelliphila palaticanis]|uniref:ABC transporter permease n=1 Tax=Gemelliphila palaticanis TaxID=81950 RepID=A0ABX2T2E6_9BACL|nr:ABC transporter permease [Gemella palaticanis]MBF0715887.1 ABC transporter permease [Gemella palaticanis]NYS47817.1 ABC transporter permease [Gemella palaticanis]
MSNNTKEKINNSYPSTWSVVSREFKKDKIALTSLIILVSLISFVILFNIYIRVTDLHASYQDVDILNRFLLPGEDGYLLGTESGGKSVFGLLMMGTMNSLIVSLCVTTITICVGTLVGLVISYYGGIVDNIAMRFIDFLVVLPYLMIIIVFVSVKKDYGIVSFIFMLSAFAWMGPTRLVRSKALSESRRDYVLASKTMGTKDLTIMLKGILPNIGSIIIVEATLLFVANMGLEVALSFLGFGLPVGTASIGTLLSYAKDADILVNKMYIWGPAALVILILALSINYIGQALRRALDARQRL